MKINHLLHLFIPHPKTHEKAKLLSWNFLLVYILLFILLKASFGLLDVYKPGVLGVNSSISVEQVIYDTNLERQKNGLSPLAENPALSSAAKLKAQNMFDENYWAHFSPSGKDPWGFIAGAGYKFSYAGENLARNFYNADDVVKAWMDSPSHKENILNSHYQDIGIAVVDGILQGQKTTLVVQMFGEPYDTAAAASAPLVDLGGKKISVKPQDINQVQRKIPVAEVKSLTITSPALFNPFEVSRIAGISIISIIAFLLALDFMILKKRGVFRLSSHHFAHFGFLTFAGISMFLSKAGEIL